MDPFWAFCIAALAFAAFALIYQGIQEHLWRDDILRDRNRRQALEDALLLRSPPPAE